MKRANWGTGWGCLALSAIPFLCFGIAASWWCLRLVQQHAAMAAWVETPAKILKAELKTHTDEDTTFEAIATYEYVFGGKRFTGERVSIDGGSDNIGRFQRKAYAELKRHQQAGKPFRCYVNPAQPSDAVLYRNLRGEMLVFYTLFATTFGAAGLALLTAAMAVAWRTPSSPPEAIPADQPWLDNSEWAAGRIHESAGRRTSVPVLGAVALYWTIAVLPLIFAWGEVWSQGGGWRWGAPVFLAIGLGLACAFLHQLLAMRKFGESVLQLASTPGVVGGQLAGVIHIPRQIHAPDGFRLKLSCIEHTGSGDDKKKDVRWQAERIILEPMRDDVACATALPVLFAIPFECAPVSAEGAGRVEWRLEASARLTGVDYRSNFAVPVFKTGASRPDFEVDEELLAGLGRPPGPEQILAEAGILKEPTVGDGLRLVFPAARNWGRAIPIVLFFAVWTGTLWLMIGNAPLVFPIVFGLFELLIGWLMLDTLLYSSVVEARQDELAIRGGWLGIGRRHVVPGDQIKQFTTSEYMSSDTYVAKSIVVELRGGGKRTIAKAVSSPLAQQLIIEELNTALGRG